MRHRVFCERAVGTPEPLTNEDPQLAGFSQICIDIRGDKYGD